jgi:hypothetical protein
VSGGGTIVVEEARRGEAMDVDPVVKWGLIHSSPLPFELGKGEVIAENGLLIRRTECVPNNTDFT